MNKPFDHMIQTLKEQAYRIEQANQSIANYPNLSVLARYVNITFATTTVLQIETKYKTVSYPVSTKQDLIDLDQLYESAAKTLTESFDQYLQQLEDLTEMKWDYVFVLLEQLGEWELVFFNHQDNRKLTINPQTLTVQDKRIIHLEDQVDGFPSTERVTYHVDTDNIPVTYERSTKPHPDRVQALLNTIPEHFAWDGVSIQYRP